MNQEDMKKSLEYTNMFRKEPHYIYLLIFLVSCHVLFMTYLLPKGWADTPTSLEIIKVVGSIVPVVRNIKINMPSYTNYWGLFYSIFWIMAPLFMILGFLSSFFYSTDRYEKVVLKMSLTRFSIILVFCVLFVCLEFEFPLLSFGPFMNQMSKFLPKLLVSWFASACILYATAQMIRILFLKLSLSNNQTLEK